MLSGELKSFGDYYLRKAASRIRNKHSKWAKYQIIIDFTIYMGCLMDGDDDN